MEKKFRDDIRKRLENKRKSMGIKENISYGIEIVLNSSSPIVNCGIFGEAYPHRSPPKVELEIYPCELSEGEINKVITDELLHIKKPQLNQYEEKGKTSQREEWKKDYQKYLDE